MSYSEALRPNLAMTANLYGSCFHRDWWRQSSNSAQRPNRLGEPGCAGMADLNTGCGNEGRLRRYYTWSVEPHVRPQQRLGPLAGEADFGVRGHFEDQDCQQRNGLLPWSRDGRLMEDNRRRTQAWSNFWQYRLVRGRLGLARGLRLEHVRYQRRNRLNGASGRTEHQGLEGAGRWQLPQWFGPRHSLWVRAAYTWLPAARFAGTRYSSVPGFLHVSVRGNRLPYAPRHLANASLTYAHGRGTSALVEAVATSRQFADDLNTVAPTPNGQRGLIPGNVLWNATLTHPLESLRATLFLTVKNLTDRLVIVDRVRGILPSHPRLVQFGLSWQF